MIRSSVSPSLTCYSLEFLNAGTLVREPNSENCLDFIFAAPPCEKVITIPDTNYIISATRKFTLDIPNSGSFQI